MDGERASEFKWQADGLGVSACEGRLAVDETRAPLRSRWKAYMERLGMWGSGTAFYDFAAFKMSIDSSGMGAMELVALDMKRRGMCACSLCYPPARLALPPACALHADLPSILPSGLHEVGTLCRRMALDPHCPLRPTPPARVFPVPRYISRQLSFKSAEFDTDIIDLTAKQVNMYDAAAVFWSELLDCIDYAKNLLKIKSQKGHPSSKIMTHYWGWAATTSPQHASLAFFELAAQIPD